MEQTPVDEADFEAVRASGPLGVALGPTANEITRELIDSALAGAVDLGWDARLVRPGERQGDLGVLLGIGYQGSFITMMSGPRTCRRVVWVGESVAARGGRPGAAPGPLVRIARSPAMDALMHGLRPFKDWPLPGPLVRVRASATVEREQATNLRNLAALAESVDRIVVTSRDRQAVLAGHGIGAEAVPFGYAPTVAGPLTPPDQGGRDLAIVSIGNRHPRQSARRAVVDEWQTREPRLHVLAGVWGSERNDLLRRSRVVLNVSRTPGDFVGVRLILTIAAGAVLVSEPMTDPFPFVPGVHFVEAPLEGLLDAARDLEADEPRRLRMAAAGRELIAGELAMANCLRRAVTPAALVAEREPAAASIGEPAGSIHAGSIHA